MLVLISPGIDQRELLFSSLLSNISAMNKTNVNFVTRKIEPSRCLFSSEDRGLVPIRSLCQAGARELRCVRLGPPQVQVDSAGAGRRDTPEGWGRRVPEPCGRASSGLRPRDATGPAWRHSPGHGAGCSPFSRRAAGQWPSVAAW